MNSDALKARSKSTREKRKGFTWDAELLERIRRYLLKSLEGQGNLPLAAEDLVSDALVRLLGHDPAGIQAPFAYARTIVRHLIRDRIRQLERTRRLFKDVAENKREDLEPQLDRGVVEEGDLLGWLLQNTELSPLQEKVINMMYFEGKTITEAARVLDRNPGTVLRHHDRAIEKLAQTASRLEAQR